MCFWDFLPFLFRKLCCHECLTSVVFPSLPHQAEQRILSRVHSLERRLDALAAEFSSSWQKEAMRLERLELQQGAGGQGGGGGGLSHEDTLALLEGLVSRREAALKEDLRRDTAARIQAGTGAEEPSSPLCGWHPGCAGRGVRPHTPDMTWIQVGDRS